MRRDAIVRRAAPWLIGLGGLVLFTAGLDHRDFIHLEARFALFAQEMSRQGVSVFPTVYGAPYPDYPAAGTILIDLVSRLAGGVTTATAVLPTAAAAAITLVFTYLIGALHSPRWGLYAVLFEVGSYQFLASARSVSLDPFIAMVTAGCFYLAYSSVRLDRPVRTWLIPVGWLAGFAVRGPIGLIIPASVVISCALLERRWRRVVALAAVSVALLALGTIGLLAAARAQGGADFADLVLRAQAIGRVAAGAAAHPPIYSYPVNALAAFALSMPVAAALAAIAFGPLIRPATNEWRLLRLLAAWIAVIIAGLSIPSKQEIRYLLPVVPAAALMAGALLAEPSLHPRLAPVRRWVLRLFLWMPWLGLGVVVAGVNVSRLRAFMPGTIHPAPIIILLAGLAGLTLAARRVRDPAGRELAGVVLGVAAFVAVHLAIVEPVAVDLNRVGPFVDQVRLHRDTGGPIAFYKIGPDGADVKFMAVFNEPVRPFFIRTAAELDALPPRTIVIADRGEFDALPPLPHGRLRLLVTGRIARSACVAFAVDPRPAAPNP